MQKKIIALAIAALASGAAFAQSNVTIYGVADAYLASSKTDQANRQNLVQSGGLSTSRLGFKGAEDLGNGLKAIFALEYRLEIDNNSGVGFNSATTGPGSYSSGPARQQLVGLTGGFGTAVAGRLQTTGYDWAVKYDVLAGTAFSPLQNVNAATQIRNVAGVGGALIGGTTVAARASNAVAYISPSFSGLTFAYNHAELQEQSGANGNGIGAPAAGPSVLANGGNNIPADLVGVYYDNGPLSVGGAYARVKNTGAAAGAVDKTADWGLGASYDLKVAKLGVTYQRTKTTGDASTAALNPQNADTAWSLGAVVPVSAAGNVIASYAKNNVKSTSASDNTKSWTLAYTHALSKRTTAYVGYSSVGRDSGIAPAVAGAPAGSTAGADTNTFLAGVNHKF